MPRAVTRSRADDSAERMHSGSVPTVLLSCSNASRRRSGDAILIAIQDTGIGIPRAALQKLGRPFEQVESQLTKTHHGSGLGLAIAKSLVELHGGAMRIASRPGVGTIVAVRLPMAGPRRAEAAETARVA